MIAVAAAGACTLVDIDVACNATAATYDDDRRAGAVNAWGNSLPAEEVPFGRVVDVDGVPFRLPAKRGRHDHVEAVGQTLPLPSAAPVAGLALLCFGEMGEQDVALMLLDAAGAAAHLVADVPGWLAAAPEGRPDLAVALRCTHLHYPGGYELAALRPTVTRWTGRLSRPVEATGLRLGINPLFHVLAVTLLHEGVRDAA